MERWFRMQSINVTRRFLHLLYSACGDMIYLVASVTTEIDTTYARFVK